MTHPDSQTVNHLVAAFMDLQEAWESDPDGFDWRALDAIVQQGAHAYNEGNGPSFHSLALDGVRHSAFHERFLLGLLDAGFNPFMLTSAGNGGLPIPVIDHAVLAESAEANPSSARMRAALQERARDEFAPLLRLAENGDDPRDHPLFAQLRACAESVPDDLIRSIAPEMAGDARATASKGAVQDGYLTKAELQVERQRRPLG